MDLLEKLVSLPSVSGSEDKYSKKLEEIFSSYCESNSDIFGNVYGFKKNGNGKTKILIDAHIDIIGLMVTKIHDDGILSFACVGGVDTRILPSMRVVVHGKENVKGVIGVPPPHLLKGDETETYKVENLTIDTGYTKEEISRIVEIGDLISFDSGFTRLLNKRISAGGLDNKLGVYCALKSLEKIKREDTEIVVAATCGEEINLNGARIAGNLSEFDLCIVIDVTHGTTPDSKEDLTFELGKGPSIALGPGLSKKHNSQIISYAKEHNIPFCYEVTSGRTGTNANAYNINAAGMDCVILSLPLKYMHTACEVADMKDADALVELVSGFINECGEI